MKERSKLLVELKERVFKEQTSATDYGDIMYLAGQLSIIEWVQRAIKNT